MQNALVNNYLNEIPSCFGNFYRWFAQPVSKAVRIASPIHYVRPNLPPTLLVYGNRDHIVKPIFSQQLHDRLRFTNNTSVPIALPWAEHSFDAVFREIGNQIALYYTEGFLAWALRE